MYIVSIFTLFSTGGGAMGEKMPKSKVTLQRVVSWKSGLVLRICIFVKNNRSFLSFCDINFCCLILFKQNILLIVSRQVP